MSSSEAIKNIKIHLGTVDYTHEYNCDLNTLTSVLYSIAYDILLDIQFPNDILMRENIIVILNILFNDSCNLV